MSEKHVACKTSFPGKLTLLLSVTYRWVRNRLLRLSERKTMARCCRPPLVSQFSVSVTETSEFPSRCQPHHNTTLKINRIIRIQPSCLHLVLRTLLCRCEIEIWTLTEPFVYLSSLIKVGCDPFSAHQAHFMDFVIILVDSYIYIFSIRMILALLMV